MPAREFHRIYDSYGKSKLKSAREDVDKTRKSEAAGSAKASSILRFPNEEQKCPQSKIQKQGKRGMTGNQIRDKKPAQDS